MSHKTDDPARFTSIVSPDAQNLDAIFNRIANDMRHRPDTLVPLSPTLADHLALLTADVPFDTDAWMEGDVDLNV